MSEFNNIASDIINNDKYKCLKCDNHHNTNKYDHLLRVSKLSYRLAKITKADVVSTTRAGLLHDFFYGERKSCPQNSYLNHPYTSAMNAKEVFNISDFESDIIKTHMFHHAFARSFIPFINPTEKVKINESKPQSKEAWIVCISDLLVSAYEGLRFNIFERLAVYIFLLFNIFITK